MPPIIKSSDNSFASDSTINTAFSEPATTISRSESSMSSIAGFRTYSSLINPTLAPPIGPLNGTSAIDIAAEAASIATISEGFDLSNDRSKQLTCTSSL